MVVAAWRWWVSGGEKGVHLSSTDRTDSLSLIGRRGLPVSCYLSPERFAPRHQTVGVSVVVQLYTGTPVMAYLWVCGFAVNQPQSHSVVVAAAIVTVVAAAYVDVVIVVVKMSCGGGGAEEEEEEEEEEKEEEEEEEDEKEEEDVFCWSSIKSQWLLFLCFGLTPTRRRFCCNVSKKQSPSSSGE